MKTRWGITTKRHYQLIRKRDLRFVIYYNDLGKEKLIYKDKVVDLNYPKKILDSSFTNWFGQVFIDYYFLFEGKERLIICVKKVGKLLTE